MGASNAEAVNLLVEVIPAVCNQADRIGAGAPRLVRTGDIDRGQVVHTDRVKSPGDRFFRAPSKSRMNATYGGL